MNEVIFLGLSMRDRCIYIYETRGMSGVGGGGYIYLDETGFGEIEGEDEDLGVFGFVSGWFGVGVVVSRAD